MFERLETAPPDAILGLTAAFNEDPNPAKINLSVGVYKDGSGKTPIFGSVRQAEERLLASEETKSYLPIGGGPDYAAAVQGLMFGTDHEVVTSGRAVTVHTPGGTGGLRLGADFINKLYPDSKIWVSEPTWANHPNVFKDAGIAVETYPYFDPATNGLDFEAMLDCLKQIPEGDVVLLHGCCHNPSGIDPSVEQWARIGDAAEVCGWIPLVDFAYQGLGDGLENDSQGLLAIVRPGCEMFVSSSFSKNFGLYNERVGALTLVAPSEAVAQVVKSQLLICIRTNYSNPPAHGAAIVTTILSDPQLRSEWEGEVRDMCDRINKMRSLFVETLKAKGVQRDFSFITKQKGMFSFSGLTPEQVEVLRDRYAIYIVGSGRINVAGMTEANMGPLCDAIAEVL